MRELKQKVDALEQAVLEQAKKNDQEYDRVTDHGRNQATRDP
jgi:predicted secreted Zn-dependent protease